MEGVLDENGEQLLTLDEACKELGISYWQFRRYRKKGLITAARHGRILVVKRQWIRDYWTKKTKQAQQEMAANERAHKRAVKERERQRQDTTATEEAAGPKEPAA